MTLRRVLGYLVVGVLAWSIQSAQIEDNRIRGLSSEHKIRDDFIVVFKVEPSEAEAGFSRFTSHVSDISPSAKILQRFVFGRFVGLHIQADEALIKHIGGHPDVRFIEANQRVQLVAQTAPVDTCQVQASGTTLWGLSRIATRDHIDSSSQYSYLPEDGKDVNVYVVDTGVYIEHEQFEGRATRAFTATAMKSEGEDDLHGHGTHVSGIVAGRTYGVAKKANIHAVKVLNKDGVGSTVDVVEGLRFVYQDFTARKQTLGHKARGVINMSLGGSAAMSGYSFDEAIITLNVDLGLPVVVAAGNDGIDACYISPARMSLAITVGATSKADTLSSYSNQGPCLDILAPGDSIKSAYIGGPDETATLSGTSMAAPFVTGAVVRFLSQTCSSYTPADIKAFLQDTATKATVDLTTSSATPNYLLYISCITDVQVSALLGFQSGGNQSSLNDDERFLFIFISLIIIMAIGILSFLVFIVTMRRLTAMKKEMTVTSPSSPGTFVSGAVLQGYQNNRYYGTLDDASRPSAPASAASDTSKLVY